MNETNRPQIPQELFDIYDKYAHGIINRREFLDQAGRFAIAGLSAAALLEMLSPDYALAQQVPGDDSRIQAEYLNYASPKGHGRMRGYFAHPNITEKKLPGILVVHENRGLNPYIEDVVRRVAVAGFVGFGPDALTPLGGYPGNDDEGRTMQRRLDSGKITEDFIAAAQHLQQRPECNGQVGVVGFCFGGGMANTLAVRIPDTIKAAAPFYGRQPESDQVPKIKATLLLHYAELDQRINAGWPEYEAALKKEGVNYTAHMYEGANHGFHNDTTPRYDKNAAELAWKRTIEFFEKSLAK